MRSRKSIGALSLAVTLTCAMAAAWAHDETKYPDWSGQWVRPRGVGVQWDPNKPLGLKQEAPLTLEYQAILEASLKDQQDGGQGGDARYTCVPNGMPRMMTAVWPMEFVITPKVTYILYENNMPRRMYTDARAFPRDEEPSFAGYSIGKWIDTDNDGRFDTLEVETRNFKGPRTFEASGLPMHIDNETVVQERIHLDKSDKNVLLNEVTTIDHALTRPWTVTKKYEHTQKEMWFENNCTEFNNHVVVGKENYFLSADGYLMPARKDQPPPDLRYFKQTQK